MNRRAIFPGTVVMLALAGCGAAGPGTGSGGGNTADDQAVNAARVLDLNTLRAQCGGTSLPAVTSLPALIVSATKHAGYQAILADGTNLHHDEPASNRLAVFTNFDDRIRAANGGDIASATAYYEDISSQAGQTAIYGLWNTVYHRVPMMRHQATQVGYGDMALAELDYPGTDFPADDPFFNPGVNGYATLDWAGFSVPAITLSFWPGNGITGVPKSFDSDSETPDPAPGLTVVGPPIHAIFPVLSNFTALTVTCSGPTAPGLRVLVGGTVAPTVTGATQTAVDGHLAFGEVFIIPMAPLNGLAIYSYTIDANSDVSLHVSASFTTAP